MIEFSSQNIMKWSRLGMRKAYGSILCELASDHEDLISITADVADSAGLTEFSERYPDRYYNAGISEQNMVAMSAGLARTGENVFVTSFAPFVSLRVYEAIRTLVCYMDMNVKIVALSSGFSLGVQGATHYALEDIAIMRAIPDLLLLSPADTTEMAKAMEYLADYKGPAYLRLTGIPGSALVYRTDYDFTPNNFDVIREGTDVCIFSTGTLVSESVRSARLLSKSGISVGVLNMSTLNPIDTENVAKECRKCKLVLTVEEHNTVGGVGSIVAEALSGLTSHPRLIRLGTKDYDLIAGNYSYMLDKNGINAKAIAERIAIELDSFGVHAE